MSLPRTWPEGLSLAVESVTAPRTVARRLIDARPGTEGLFALGALVVIANTVLVVLQTALGPTDPAIARLLSQPLLFAASYAFLLALSSWVFAQAGRAVGGSASTEEVAICLIWLQALRAIVQVAMLALTFLAPLLAALVSIVASLAGLWVLLGFLAEAHRFDGLGKAALLVILGVTGMALGFSFLLTLLGVTIEGLPQNV